MALVACPECNAEVSSSALSCPRCGHPFANAVPAAPSPKAKSGCGPAALVIILGVVGLIALVGNNPRSTTTSTAQPTAAVQQLDASPEMQKKRKVFIDKLIAQGVFSKVEVPGSLPRAWVRPAFYTLDFDTKKAFCNAVLTYYYAENRSMDVLRLFDSRTNKPVGRFSAVTGQLVLD